MNYNAQALFTLALILTPLSQAEEPKQRERVVTANKVSMDFSEHLEGLAKWSIDQALLTLKMDEDSTVFLLNGDQEVFRLNAPEYVDGVALSEDGKALIFVVMKSSGYGSDFATLLRVQSNANSVKTDRVLESKQNLFDGSRWWLSELGAVSNDGKRVLAKFGVTSNTRMVYRWHTVDLVSGKTLSEGLTIENAKPLSK